MDIGDAKIGTVLSIHLIAEYLRGLQRIGTIPASFVTINSGVEFTVTLGSLEYEMVQSANAAPYTRLHITGSVASQNPPLVLPLDTWVRLVPELQTNGGQPAEAPTLGFRYDGVDVAPAAPLTAAMIDQLFAAGPVATIFTALNIPLLEPLIEGAGDALFPDPAITPPAAGLWAVAISLMPGDLGQNTTDALGIFINLPGEDANPNETASFLPILTEFGLVYGRGFLNARFAALNITGTVVDGATITDFTMEMGDTDIRVNGSATKDVADIEFSGPMTAQLLRGSTQFFVDASGIDVDVDLPWWVDIFFFFAGPGGILSLGLIPIFGGLAFEAFKDKTVSEALAEVDAASGIVKSSIGGTFARSITNLAQALSNLGSLDELQPALTPEGSLVENGNIAVYAQAFVNPITEDISDGTFSTRANRLLELQLNSGRWFTTSEMARIVDLGLITTPGYRAVAPHLRQGQPVRGYMQDEPDLSKADNLLTRFGI